ncbi:MAG: hypothetical protein OXF61_12880 [Acidimicrobiaceae bacterium]|nr:hypothetical protein [Acidimicrobiaceae bacterium]
MLFDGGGDAILLSRWRQFHGCLLELLLSDVHHSRTVSLAIEIRHYGFEQPSVKSRRNMALHLEDVLVENCFRASPYVHAERCCPRDKQISVVHNMSRINLATELVEFAARAGEVLNANNWSANFAPIT